MAKTRKYLVSLDPASKTAHGYHVRMNIGKQVFHEVHAASIPELLEHVERIANEYGYGAHASVQLADRNERKPAGFDKARQSLFYNLDKQPAKEAAE